MRKISTNFRGRDPKGIEKLFSKIRKHGINKRIEQDFWQII